MKHTNTTFSNPAHSQRLKPFCTSTALISTTAMLILASATTLASAQTYNTPLQHVILVIQKIAALTISSAVTQVFSPVWTSLPEGSIPKARRSR